MAAKSYILFKLCLGFSLFLASGIYGSVPVINELNIIGSSKGIALSVSADSPFDAQFISKEQYLLDIVIKNCIYGLDSFIYDNFGKNVPIKKISAKENGNGNKITISIELGQKLLFSVKTSRKGNKWLALLTDKSTHDFVWRGSGKLNSLSLDSLNRNKSDDAVLEKISVLQRDNICKLSFMFTGKTEKKIRQTGDSLLILFKDALNATGKNRYDLPENISFKSVCLKQKAFNGTQWLGAAVKLDPEIDIKPFSTVNFNGQSLVLYMKTENRNISLWTSNKGHEWDYPFYESPNYNVDMDSLSQRAQHDVNSDVEQEEYFTIQDEPQHLSLITEKTDEQKDTNSSDKDNSQDKVQSLVVEQGTGIKKETEAESRYLIATADRINVRSRPSMNGNIIDQLEYGSRLEFIKKQGAWTNVNYALKDGWVHNSLLAPDNKIEQQKPENDQETVCVEETQEKINKVSIQLHDEKKVKTENEEYKIKYKGIGRDPFVPLVSDTISENGIPFLENLRLVGILYDKNDRIALFEDFKNRNRPFALRKNDRVNNGKVLKIYRDKVVFLLTEFGVSRSITMSLSSLSDQEVRKQ
ncbi:MAG TPA: SH3 domain-containing protein [Chitinispirillaceae bacterium]|nr:SH3 domain-containing protein [Chitinispirillaceae bacterium]